MKNLVGLTILATALTVSPVLANDDLLVRKCQGPTPATASDDYPGANQIITGNNLARPMGKSEAASGQLLYISGIVMDENCVPVVGAQIDLWQTTPFGLYRFASQDELTSPEPVFAGNGRATTDNYGRYEFVTLFPGVSGKRAPKIQLRIAATDFAPIFTSFYFKGDTRNNDDSRFRALKPASQEALQAETHLVNPNAPQAGVKAEFNITLKGKNKYRSY